MFDMLQVFRGGLNNFERKVQLFTTPVEARYVRINPSTWTDTIALGAQVLGCGEATSTPTEPTTVIPTTVLPGIIYSTIIVTFDCSKA